MIATILPGSTNFHAVGYNQRKVSKGVARLLEILNFGNTGTFGKPTTEELVNYLNEYSSANDRIKKAQFHLAISCKGHEMSEKELLDFAQLYLKEMGYMEPGQPILVYSHYDTDNTHLHIVTSRVGPDGRKINDHHERRRSQEVIDKIMGQDPKKKVMEDFEAAKQYTFNSFAKFKAIMSSMGYETYEKNDTVFIKYGGKVLLKVPYADFNGFYSYGKTDISRTRQLRSILKKYRDVCADQEDLKKELKSKLGIDLVFFGRKDSPYGYMLVDHSRKSVYHGARVLALNELLDFTSPEERFDRVESFIDSLFSINPKITQDEICDKLKRQRAYIKNGVIHFDGRTRPLKQFMVDALARNNRIKWIESFNPVTAAERDLLCKMGKGCDPSLVSLSSVRPTQYVSSLNRLHDLFDDMNIADIRGELRNEGFIIKKDGDDTFAIDFSRNIIINLSEEGFDLNRLQSIRKLQPKKQPSKPKKQLIARNGKMKIRDVDTGRGENREWEVGYKGDYDRIDDSQSLKR